MWGFISIPEDAKKERKIKKINKEKVRNAKYKET